MALVGDEGKTIRFPATALLTIDSDDRFKTMTEKREAKGSSPYDFTIAPGNGGRSILGGFIRRMGVSEVQFPWCIPNVNFQTSKMNIKWSGPGGTFESYITLDPGFYNPSELATAVEAAVQALSPDLSSFLMRYSDPLYKDLRFGYDTTNSTTIAFFPLPNESTSVSGIGEITSQTTQLFDLLGFTVDNSVLDNNGHGLSTLCQFTKYIDIECAQLTQFQGLFDGTTQPEYRDALCRLYLGDNQSMMNISPSDPNFCPPGTRPFVIYRQFQNMKQINWNARNNIGSFLQFRVFNDNGQILTQSAEVVPSLSYENWNMTILASEN